MGRLGGHEKFVHRQLGGFREKSEIRPEFHHGEEVERFFRGDGPRVAEDPVGAADLVEKHIGAPLKERLAGVLLVLDDLLDDFDQTVDDFLLGFAQRGLVGNLEKIAQRLGALAVKPAHGESDFADRIDDLVDLLGEDEARKVHHGRGAEAGADIGRARREVTEFRMERVGHAILEEEVGFVVDLVGLAQLQPRQQRLHAQVILLVDHDAELLVAADHHRAARAFRGVLAADEVAFDEDLFLQRREIGERRVESRFHRGNGRDVVADFAENLHALGFLGPTGEGALFQIPREADAAAYHDLAVRTFSLQPLAGVGHNVVESHACSSCSSFWISSRRRAASSYFSSLTAFFRSPSSDLTRSAMA